MKGETLFEKMTDISEQYIAEASLAGGSERTPTAEDIPTIAVTPSPKKRFPYALIGGVAAACLCLVVSVAVLAGLLAGGLTDPSFGSSSTPSAPIFPNTPLWQRFEFSYDITDGTGKPLASAARPGDTVLVDTTLINRGLPFFYTGSSSEFCAHAQFVLQGNETVTIDGGIFHTTDVGTFPVLMGEEGQGQYFFTIPENATPGVYDLVLSYKNTKQVFSGVLTVEEPSVPIDPSDPSVFPGLPEDTTDHPFSFGYELPDDARPGDIVSIPTWIINEGVTFTFEGASNSFAPTAILVHMGTQYRIHSSDPVTGDWVTVTVEAGERNDRTQTFLIPEDAPVGVYALSLTFGEMTQSFPGVLIVTDDPTAASPLEDGHPFSFGYQPLPFDNLFISPGDRFNIEAWVMNVGASFTFVGDPYSFQPSLTLYHMESDYTVKGTPPPTGVEPRLCLITVGQTGKTNFTVRIPDDAPEGVYGLRLSYGGAQETFENVLTVTRSVVEKPAILYNLTMPIGSDWLYEPIDGAYVDGEEVTVRIQFATDVGTLFFLNGEVIPPSDGDDQMGYREYRFIMPQKDSEIIFQTYDGMAPYGDILKAYYIANPKAEGVLVSDYGTYGDGVRVAILYDGRFVYTSLLEESRIGPAVIRYPDGNSMQALHDGVFCSLSKAYAAGLLSDADLAALENLQRERNPHLYADDE